MQNRDWMAKERKIEYDGWNMQYKLHNICNSKFQYASPAKYSRNEAAATVAKMRTKKKKNYSQKFQFNVDSNETIFYLKSKNGFCVKSVLLCEMGMYVNTYILLCVVLNKFSLLF